MRAVAVGLAAGFCASACLADGPAGPNPPPSPDGLVCDGPTDPGRVTLHRLNRLEYNNTVRDLLDDRSRPADQFPSDDHGYGFDNNADVLSMGPLLFEKYELAAEALAQASLKVDSRQTTRFEAEQVGAPIGEVYAETNWILYEEVELFGEVSLPLDGRYELSARAFGQQSGPEPVRMQFLIDGAPVATFDVVAAEASPEVYRHELTLSAGEHRFGVAFINDYYNPDDPFPEYRDRNLVLDWFALDGPMDAPASSPRRDALIPCDLEADRAGCTEEVLSSFARRAWRREVTNEERKRLVDLATVAWEAEDSADAGIGLGLTAILLSPHFVFRVELDPEPNSDEPHPIGDYELAARLSYFLWSSTPDDTLLDLAKSGDLADPEILIAQAQRMLDDPRSDSLLDGFVGQWLWTRKLRDVTPDAATFPEFDTDLAESMRQETELVFSEILRGPYSALDLLDAPFTYLDDRLARHYGLAPTGSNEMKRVELGEGNRRAGIFGHGSLLTVTSQPRRTSPVKRGKWILEQLLCNPPSPPPSGVTNFPEPEEPTGSLRERFEEHRKEPVCAHCHAVMDPLGFSLEHFDAVGKWRETDSGFEIDTSGVLPPGEPFTDHLEMAQILKRDPQTPRCMTNRLLTYALGRGLSQEDRCQVEAITSEFADSGYTFKSLFEAIVTSPAFTQRRGEPQ